MTSRSLLSLTVAAFVVLAGCGDGGAATGAPTDGATGAPVPTGTTAPASEAPLPTTEATPTEAPPTEEPTEGPTEAASGEPSAPAAACTGSEQNQEFYAQVAAAVDWPVLCLAEDGWVVTTGSYSLRSGGRIEIGYRGPGGATVELREGYICDGEGCAPAGTVVRDTTFGELGNAQLIELEDGAFAVVADPDANPSWILVSSGLTGDELADLAAGFATVGG